jgi:hypothetical protein
MSDENVIAAKIKIYLDTTVPSAYFDQRTPERLKQTVHFWEQQMPEYEACISRLLLDEIGRTPDQVRRREMLLLVGGLPVLEQSEAAISLAQAYLQAGVFPLDALVDARHVAIAVTSGIGYLISWNYQHLVKAKTRKLVNEVNTKKEWGLIDIITPPEL